MAAIAKLMGQDSPWPGGSNLCRYAVTGSFMKLSAWPPNATGIIIILITILL